MLSGNITFDTVEDLERYLEKDKSNNSPSCRKMRIMKGDKLVANLLVNTQSGFPLLSVPKPAFDDIKIVDINSKGPANLTHLSGYTFSEFFTLKGVTTVDENIYNEVISKRKTIGGVEKDTRYKPIGEVINPNTGLMYTFFLDAYHNDIFVVCGLNYILNDNIKIIAKEDSTYLHIDGYSIITNINNYYKFRSNPITTTLSTPSKDVACNSIDNLNWDMLLKNFKAYFIPCNKDVILSNGTNIVPTIYDKYISPNREIQLAKYPVLVVEFGVSTDLLLSDPTYDTINNFIITAESNNRLSYVYNSNNYTKTTTFGVAITGI